MRVRPMVLASRLKSAVIHSKALYIDTFNLTSVHLRRVPQGALEPFHPLELSHPYYSSKAALLPLRRCGIYLEKK